MDKTSSETKSPGGQNVLGTKRPCDKTTAGQTVLRDKKACEKTFFCNIGKSNTFYIIIIPFRPAGKSSSN
jgi:hypothetical protein